VLENVAQKTNGNEKTAFCAKKVRGKPRKEQRRTVLLSKKAASKKPPSA
jgi:hypothetical protein